LAVASDARGETQLKLPGSETVPTKRRGSPARRRGRLRSPILLDREARQRPAWRLVARLAVEIGALVSAALVAVIFMLGHAADWFGGTGLWSHLLPFAGAVLALAVGVAVFLRGWLRVRSWLMRHWLLFPAVLAVALAAAAMWFTRQPTFDREVGNLRTLVGGSAEAERAAIGHQVYAAYRRADLTDVQRILERARVFEPTVREAAAAFDVDSEVLMGIGSTESSFYPRDSPDGGRGLFQITAPPQVAVKQARKRLAVSELDPLNQRHNAFVAAATLRHYLAEMHGDLFLGLLAYNIGPRNGGLRTIMRQYGARDFVTIQPYLQHLPRDYPIRVLSAALAYRLWRLDSRLPHYELGDNAARIQNVGIPGLQAAPRASATPAGDR